MKRRFFTILLSLILVFGFSFNTYAADIGAAVTAFDIMSSPDFKFETVVDRFGFSIIDGSLADKFVTYLDEDYLQEGHGGAGYSRGDSEKFINDTILVDVNNRLVFSEDFNDAVVKFLKKYTEERPLGYSYQHIYPYSTINVNHFTLDQYNAFLSFLDNLSDSSSYFAIYYNVSGGNLKCYVVAFPKEINFDFLSSVSMDNFISFNENHHVNVSHNWNVYTGSLPPNFRAYQFMSDSSYSALGSIGISNFYNPQLTINYAGNRWCLYSASKTRSSDTIVFHSLESLKAYSSGVAAPYYFGSNFGVNPGMFSMGSSQYTSTDNSYTQIVEQVTNGMSSQDVIDLVDNILNHNINNNGSGGSGDSGSDDDLGFLDKLFDSIGKLFKKIIEGIASIITSVVEGLESVVDSIIDIVSRFIGWFTGDESGIINFLKVFMSWLPEPLPTLLISLFTVAVIFAVVRLVKGALS